MIVKVNIGMVVILCIGCALLAIGVFMFYFKIMDTVAVMFMEAGLYKIALDPFNISLMFLIIGIILIPIGFLVNKFKVVRRQKD